MKTKPNLTRRAFATVLDLIVLFMLVYPFFYFAGERTPDGALVLEGLPALVPLICWYVYFPVLESMLGFTPAKFLFGLRVVNSNGTRVSLWSATKRRILDIVDLLSSFGLVAFIVVKCTATHQRCGDFWAKAFVVKTSDIKGQT
jgi:uncharacterized RDD family membrane protein YckC